MHLSRTSVAAEFDPVKSRLRNVDLGAVDDLEPLPQSGESRLEDLSVLLDVVRGHGADLGEAAPRHVDGHPSRANLLPFATTWVGIK